MITDTFGESDQAASARSLYLAMTQLASDNGSETFTATKALIAHKAGLSVSTVQRLLKGFEQLGLTKIEREFAERNSGAIRAPNNYTLLALGHGDATTLGHGRRRRSNPDKVKERERKQKETKKETHSAVFSANGLSEKQKQIIARFNEIFPQLGFLPVNEITPAVRTILAHEDCTRERWDELANDPASWPHERKFTKLFWHARTAANRLAAMRSKQLQSLRSKLIDERNSGKLSRKEKDAKRKQLLEIKQILKGRGIEYPASL